MFEYYTDLSPEYYSSLRDQGVFQWFGENQVGYEIDVKLADTLIYNNSKQNIYIYTLKLLMPSEEVLTLFKLKFNVRFI